MPDFIRGMLDLTLYPFAHLSSPVILFILAVLVFSLLFKFLHTLVFRG